jgi:hypothetical protein
MPSGVDVKDAVIDCVGEAMLVETGGRVGWAVWRAAGLQPIKMIKNKNPLVN